MEEGRRGNESMGPVPFRRHPPWWLAPPPSPPKRGHHGCWAACHMILRVSVERSILSPEWGWPPQVANSAGEEQGHEMHCGRGRRLAVSYAIECHGGAMPRTPFCCFAALSLKGKQEIELENLCVKCALCHSGGSPLWWLRHHLCPAGKRVTRFSGR